MEYIDINLLKNSEINPRKIDDKQFKILCESLQKNPDYFEARPILANKDMVVFAGNMRLRAARHIGMTKVPAVIMDISEERQKEIMIRDNRQNGVWDNDMLANHFDISQLKEYGFSESEFGIFKEPRKDDDSVPTPRAETTIKRGDLFKIGRHYVMCGDSTDSKDFEKLMKDARADMIFTDPPYNVDYSGMQNSKQWVGIENDFMTPELFKEFLQKVFLQSYNFSKEAAALYICHSDKSHVEFRQAFEKAGYDWRVTIIWVKNSPAFNFAQYKYMHEPIFYCFKKDKVVNWYGDMTKRTVWHEEWDDEKILKWYKRQIESDKGKGSTTVWEANKERGDHPTIKPVELIKKAIYNSSLSGDIILDPFLGSGSTLIASETTGRTCYGLEIDPHYVEVILRRYEDYTGNKRELL